MTSCCCCWACFRFLFCKRKMSARRASARFQSQPRQALLARCGCSPTHRLRAVHRATRQCKRDAWSKESVAGNVLLQRQRCGYCHRCNRRLKGPCAVQARRKGHTNVLSRKMSCAMTCDVYAATCATHVQSATTHHCTNLFAVRRQKTVYGFTSLENLSLPEDCRKSQKARKKERQLQQGPARPCHVMLLISDESQSFSQLSSLHVT